jgi:hypothetical protein
MPLVDLLDYGRRLFEANWTIQEGAGRPRAKGTGRELADPTKPLVFPRNFNRISGPDSNSCTGCHNSPHGIPGGNGDIVANVFVLGQRFDFADFNPENRVPTAGRVTSAAGSSTSTPSPPTGRRRACSARGIEMLARQMTADLQAIRDTIRPSGSRALVTKGISFGTLKRGVDGRWDTSGVEGLPFPSVYSNDGETPPDLIIRPFHQAGNVISLRQFTNTALHHHHGIQTEERFSVDARYNVAEHFRPDVDDGDAIAIEATRADVTACTVPGGDGGYGASFPTGDRSGGRDGRAPLHDSRLRHHYTCGNCHSTTMAGCARAGPYSVRQPPRG